MLTKAQINAVLKACSGNTFRDVRDRAIIFLLLESGIRRFELAALHVRDLDFPNRRVTVPCGKGGKQRNAKFNGIARSALMRLLAERGGSL